LKVILYFTFIFSVCPSYGQTNLIAIDKIDSTVTHFFKRNMFPPINSNYDDLVDGFAFFKVIKEDSLFKSSLFLISDTSFNFTFSRGFLGNLNAVFPKKMNGEYCLIIPVQFFYLRSKSLSLKQQTIFQKQIVELSRRNLRIGKTVFCYSPEAIRRGCPH
jgi:hypothetical protein